MITQKVADKKTSKVKKILQIYTIFLVDESGSMMPNKNHVIRLLDDQIESIKENDNKNNTNTRICIGTFSGKGINKRVDFSSWHDSRSMNSIDPSSYNPRGETPLYDAIIEAGDIFPSSADAYNLIVITDGEENSSSSVKSTVKYFINHWNSTKTYTVSFCMPPGGRHYAIDIGAFRDCVIEWTPSEEGIKNLSRSITKGITETYAGYNSGSYSNKQFFAPDVNFSKKTLSSYAVNITNRFTVLEVKPIPTNKYTVSTYIKSVLGKFEIGRTFYQLTKPETVQDFKDIVIRDITTHKIFAGPNIRNLLNIPKGGTIELNPANSNKYQIFIRSTSWNRNLVPNTIALYYESDQPLPS